MPSISRRGGDHGFTSFNGCRGFPWDERYDDDCIPLFYGPGDTKKRCERYWKNNQDDIREEWLQVADIHARQVTAGGAPGAILPSPRTQPVALPANHVHARGGRGCS